MVKPSSAARLPHGYLAIPKAGKGSGLLVLHSWWGLNDFFKGLCDRFADEDFVSLAPDIYGGKVATSIAQAQQLRATPKKEPIYKTYIRAIEHLRTHPAVQDSHIGVVGYSMGAHWACWLAQRPELPIKATVLFYGARDGDYSRSQSAFQSHFAESDEWVSAASIKKLGKSLHKAACIYDSFTYANTQHWFYEADRPEYNPQAAELAWERTLEFLKTHP